MFKNKIFRIFSFMIFAFTPYLHAADSDGFAQVFNAFWGTEQARNNLKVCVFQDGDNNMGLLGAVNSLFCHLEKDMGITGPATVTKTFGNIAVHVVVAGSVGGGSYGGYDFEAKVWTCKKAGATQCNATNQFNQNFYLRWTYKADKTVNKGLLLMDTDVFPTGSTGAPVYISWDVGTSTGTRTVTVKAANFDGGSNNNFKMEGVSSISGTVVKAGMNMITGGATQTGYRFAGAYDISTAKAAAYFASIGTGDTSASDTPSLNCFQRSASGGDWTYTTSTGCPGSVTMPADSLNVLSSTWNNSTNFYSNVDPGNLWSGMGANPPSL